MIFVTVGAAFGAGDAGGSSVVRVPENGDGQDMSVRTTVTVVEADDVDVGAPSVIVLGAGRVDENGTVTRLGTSEEDTMTLVTGLPVAIIVLGGRDRMMT